jgi:ABC-type multidrug transport system ATPase subunit
MVNGYDILADFRKIRSCVGYMPGKFSLYLDLSVEENLNFFATIFNTTVKENYNLIQDIYEQLMPFKDRKAGKLSGGMKQKLALCCALIHKPDVLFLDEPTTGVDVVSRKEFWQMLSRLKAQGLTILVSTPYMDEALLCDRIAFMNKGDILSINTPAEILSQFPHPLFGIQTTDTFHLMNSLRALECTHTCFAFGESIHWVPKPAFNQDDLRKQLAWQGPAFQLEKIKPTLEDCFIELLNQPHDTGN